MFGSDFRGVKIWLWGFRARCGHGEEYVVCACCVPMSLLAPWELLGVLSAAGNSSQIVGLQKIREYIHSEKIVCASGRHSWMLSLHFNGRRLSWQNVRAFLSFFFQTYLFESSFKASVVLLSLFLLPLARQPFSLISGVCILPPPPNLQCHSGRYAWIT